MYRPCFHCQGKAYDPDYCPEICTYGEDRKRLKELEEAAAAAPVVHGKWVDRYGGKHAYPVFVCSVCKAAALLGFGYEHITQTLSAYCPNCGAKMDKEPQPKENIWTANDEFSFSGQ